MKNGIISVLLILVVSLSFGQGFPEGISYQAQIFDEDGAYLAEKTVGIQFNIRINTFGGTIVWQEQHDVMLNEVGYFTTVIGEGVSTGIGIVPSFDQINWSSGAYFLELRVDKKYSGIFKSVLTQQLVAVPFAFHAKTTDQKFALSQLTDVDTSGIKIGDILKWNGTNWVASVDKVADTVSYAVESNISVYSDTANFAFNCENPTRVDSANYSYYADSVNFAYAGLYSIYSDTSTYADTANYASYAINNWGIEGNDNIDATHHFIGTVDSVDLVLKSFGKERMRIKANGKIGIGIANPTADFQIDNTNGVLFTGTHGSGVIPIEGVGSRMMWYPKKSAFRAGFVNGNRWDDSNIGEYSFAAGYNTSATKSYAVAFGYSSSATNEGSFAAGNVAVASGLYSFAVGHNPTASGNHSVAIGRGAVATKEGAIALGYHPTASGNYALSIGNYVTASGENSVALGYRTQSLHAGSFIWSDYSTPAGFIATTAPNQFMVRASGGIIFYTSADLSTGVVLAPGAGAWSILSDRNMKENILAVDLAHYLEKLDDIEVYQYNYKSQSKDIKHIGPMAQDFHAVFGLGVDNTTINSGDFDGVNLVLLKALNEKIIILEEKQSELNSLYLKLDELKIKRQELLHLLEEIQGQQGTNGVRTANVN